MARQYAGIMALVGMTVVLLRATKNGISFDSAMLTSIAWMAVLGVVGLVLGAVAQATVEQSVLQQIEQELDATNASRIATR